MSLAPRLEQIMFLTSGGMSRSGAAIVSVGCGVVLRSGAAIVRGRCGVALVCCVVGCWLGWVGVVDGVLEWCVGCCVVWSVGYKSCVGFGISHTSLIFGYEKKKERNERRRSKTFSQNELLI